MGRGRMLVEHAPKRIYYPKPGETWYGVMKFACDRAK